MALDTPETAARFVVPCHQDAFVLAPRIPHPFGLGLPRLTVLSLAQEMGAHEHPLPGVPRLQRGGFSWPGGHVSGFARRKHMWAKPVLEAPLDAQPSGRGVRQG
jgi:hypothetical protein